MKQTKESLIALTRDGYDRMAKDWAGTRMNFWKEISSIAKTHIKGGDRVLDLGCGNARFYREVQDMNILYSGCDISALLLEQAKKYHPTLDLCLCNALSTPYEDASFNVVVSFAVAHHIPTASLQENFFKEIERLLVPGGTAILTVWNIWKTKKKFIIGEWWRHIREQNGMGLGDTIMGFTQHTDTRYVYAFTERSLRKRIAASGLSILDISYKGRVGGQENILVILQKK